MSQTEVTPVVANDTKPGAKEQEEDPLSKITPAQLSLITETWAIASVDLQAAGLVMFKKLFEIAPELIEIFPFDGEDLNDDNVSLRKHSMQVMQSINDALGMADQPEELKETLIGLGVVHNMSNVQLESFAPVGQALIYALGDVCKDKFTFEARTAWVALYTAVQHYMTLGMIEGLDA